MYVCAVVYKSCNPVSTDALKNAIITSASRSKMAVVMLFVC